MSPCSRRRVEIPSRTAPCIKLKLIHRLRKCSGATVPVASAVSCSRINAILPVYFFPTRARCNSQGFSRLSSERTTTSQILYHLGSCLYAPSCPCDYPALLYRVREMNVQS